MPISIVSEKKSIVDNILKATTICGTILISFVFIRDMQAGISVFNSVFNGSLVLFLIAAILSGNRINYEKKTWVILIVLSVLGTKSLLVNGTTESSFHFFIFSGMIALLILDRRTANTIIIILSVAYVIITFLFAFDIIEPVVDPADSRSEGLIWIGRVAFYLFLLFIVIGGVGRMQNSFQKSIDELNESNRMLNQSNEELVKQLEYTREMESKVSEKEMNFKKLFDESNDGIIVCDAAGQIIESNQIIATMLGYPKTYLLGNQAGDFVIPDDKALINQLEIDKIHNKKIRELNLVNKQGIRIPVEVNYGIIYLNESKSILVTIRDIRERKLSEQKLLNAVIQAEENERARFAKDLHDDLGPVLSSIKMYVQSMRQQDDIPEKKELISLLISTVDESIKSIRKISYNLSSHLLQNLGLIEALKTHIARINLSNAITVLFKHNFGDDCRLASNIEIVVYRVLLELISNSITHSGGNEINIELLLDKNSFVILYEDNGIGFDIEKVLNDNSKGIGLRNIFSRLNSIHGLMQFRSAGSGLSLSIDISL
jgi:PAS domain S-box-containing protein